MLFSDLAIKFSSKSRFRDKFIFHGGTILEGSDEIPSNSLVVVSGSEEIDCDGEFVIDWWILDCIRLKRILPQEWYRPLADDPFLTGYRFHFFQLGAGEEIEMDGKGSMNSNGNSMPISTLKALVKRLGGTVAENIDPDTTHIISQFHCEHLLPTQLLGPVRFCTLYWLFRSLSKGKFLPFSEALDQPCPIHAIPSSSSILICLSGFKDAHERRSINSQLLLMGFETSPTLCGRVTHLLCSQFEGEKYEVALKRFPHIKIVDRAWLDDCYRKWRIKYD